MAKKYLYEHSEQDCKSISVLIYGRWVRTTMNITNVNADKMKYWYGIFQHLVYLKSIKKVLFLIRF